MNHLNHLDRSVDPVRPRVVRRPRFEYVVLMLLFGSLFSAIYLLAQLPHPPGERSPHQHWADSFGLPYKPRGLF